MYYFIIIIQMIFKFHFKRRGPKIVVRLGSPYMNHCPPALTRTTLTDSYRKDLSYFIRFCRTYSSIRYII